MANTREVRGSVNSDSAGTHLTSELPWTDEDREARVDQRHAMMLYEAAMLMPEGSRLLEIGTHLGASAVYLEAAARERKCQLHLCDVNLRNEVRAIFGCLPHVTLHEMDGNDLLQAEPFDFVFINGDHQEPACCENLRILLSHPTLPAIIAAHDIFRMGNDAGSRWQGLVLQGHPKFTCLLDGLHRSDERTHRGLCLAFRDYDIYQKAKRTVWRHAF